MSFLSSKVQFMMFLVLGCCLSLCIQNEVLWDFTNYHYFNAWAFLEDRVGYDIAVACGNGYFNPLIDVPLYLLIKYFNDYPALISFLQGLPLGALLFVYFKIVCLFFDTATKKGKLSVLAAMLIGSTGWALYVQMGSSTNEITIAFLVMWSFYLIITSIMKTSGNPSRTLFFAGLIMGTALGLKLTAITYCLSGGATLLFFYKSFDRPLKQIGLFILGGFIGFVVFHGYWSYVLWRMYDNPLFPFANGIFKSPWFIQENFRDRTFIPQTFSQYIFFPFYVATFKLRNEGSTLLLDYRYDIVYILLIIYLIQAVFKKYSTKAFLSDKKFRLLLSLFGFSYIAWLLIFTITRYYIPVEMLSAIVIVKAARDFWPKKPFAEAFWISLCVVTLYSLLGTPYFSDILENRRGGNLQKNVLLGDLIGKHTKRAPEQKFSKYVELEELNIPDNTLLLMYNLPSSAILPIINEKAKVRGVMMKQFSYVTQDEKHIDLFDTPIWHKLKQDIISQHSGPVLRLISFHQMTQIWPHRNILFDKKTYCRSLRNNFFPLYLCVPHSMVEQIFVEKAHGEEILNGYQKPAGGLNGKK